MSEHPPINDDAPEHIKQWRARVEAEREQLEELGYDPKPRSKGKLPNLPSREAPLAAWRQWLTQAICLPEGWTFRAFARHGLGRTATCTISLANDEGVAVFFEVDELRELMPQQLRLTLITTLETLTFPASWTKPESEDVFSALIYVAEVMNKTAQEDETTEWMRDYVAFCNPLEGHSLTPASRVDALQALQQAPRFTKIEATELLRPSGEFESGRIYPTILLDNEEPVCWVRASEFACYIRTIRGITGISQPKISSRLSAIGIEYDRFDGRVSREKHIKAFLYRVPIEFLT